jgi:hypothetical protein
VSLGGCGVYYRFSVKKDATGALRYPAQLKHKLIFADRTNGWVDFRNLCGGFVATSSGQVKSSVPHRFDTMQSSMTSRGPGGAPKACVGSAVALQSIAAQWLRAANLRRANTATGPAIIAGLSPQEVAASKLDQLSDDRNELPKGIARENEAARAQHHADDQHGSRHERAWTRHRASFCIRRKSACRPSGALG